MSNQLVDDLIVRTLSVGVPGCDFVKSVKNDEIMKACGAVKNVFMSQPSLIEVDPPVKICGDTHGQYSDVLRLFDRGGFPPLANYLFLGDYVDRGHQNLECITLFFCYKIKYPHNFFMLRGNHECAPINMTYGFYDEVKRRYSEQLYWHINDTFNHMPLVGLVAKRILCMHGGISPKLKTLDQLRQISRPLEPQNPSLHIDLLWADPDGGTEGFTESTRGVSCVFGEDAVKDTLKLLDIDLIARAHQVVQDGYEFFAGRRCVTIFSAPHYCGQFDNAAAIMNVDENLQCSFQILRASKNYKARIRN